MIRSFQAADTSDVLRAGLLALGGATAAGAAVELAIQRHWNSKIQLVPWFAIGVLVVAFALVAVRPRRRRVAVARGLAALVLLAAAFGVVEHVWANLDAGVLDAVYSSRWESLSGVTRLWYAVTMTVGPSPPFAPGVLALAALSLLLATWRHPATERRPVTAGGTQDGQADDAADPRAG